MASHKLTPRVPLVLDFHRVEFDGPDFVGDQIGILALDAEDEAGLCLPDHAGEIVVSALELREGLMRQQRRMPSWRTGHADSRSGPTKF
ncbi:MAG: hypothetical protein U1D30_06740 [Planctomycetota bacterium]